MPKCNHCGAMYEDIYNNCPACGSPSNAAPQNEYAQNEAYNEAAERRDVSENRVYGILAYIGILWIVGLIAAPKSPFTRFHVNQGIWISICQAAVGIVLGTVSGILNLISRGWAVFITAPITLGAYAAIITFVIMGIVAASSGKKRELYLISSLPKILK